MFRGGQLGRGKVGRQGHLFTIHSMSAGRERDPLHIASLHVISGRRTASMSCPGFSVRGSTPWGRGHLIDRNTSRVYEEKVECGFHLVTQG